MRSLRVTILLLFLLILSGCSESQGPHLTLISEQKEIRLGEFYTPYYIDQGEGLFPEKEVQSYVKKVGERLARVTPRKLPYKFFVLNSGEVNAFALPGGPVMITRGMLLHLNSESELAAVLGHELGHINARHYVRFLEKRLTLNLLLVITSVFLPDNTAGEVLWRLENLGASLLTLKFSRDQEREADRYGIIFACRAGYSPYAVIKVFKTLKRLEKEHIPEWLSTHPLPETRIKEAKAFLQSFNCPGSKEKDSPEFHRIKTIVARTSDSYKLVKKAEKAYKNGDFTKASAYLQDALKIYPKNTLAALLLSILYVKHKEYKKAQKYVLLCLKYAPEWFSANIIAGIVFFYQKDFFRAETYFKEGKQLVPFKGISYYYLGRIAEARGNYINAINYYQKALRLGPKQEYWYKDCYRRYVRLIS
jgi:predicted Zn-dependent protease